MTFRPGQEVPQNISFRFLVDGHPDYSHDVISNGSTFSITQVSSNDPYVTINCDKDSYLLFVYGRILASDKRTGLRIHVEGDDSFLILFEEWFKGL